MIEKLNSKIRPLLDIHERLKDVLTLANIRTPKIATWECNRMVKAVH